MEWFGVGFGTFFLFLGIGAAAGLVWGFIKIVPLFVFSFREGYAAFKERLR